VLDKDGKVVVDENTNYLIATILDPKSIAKETNTVNREVTSNKFLKEVLPDSLLEWIAVIVLIFILVILGRNVYQNIKGNSSEAH
jgi:hypothetical protein